jgi:hypothetical protein
MKGEQGFMDLAYAAQEAQDSGFSGLVGKRLIKVIVTKDDDKADDSIQFICDNGDILTLQHYQDCCEHVYIEDICGDLDDIVGHDIYVAEAREQEYPGACESGTWTFYTIRTIKGTVDIRWIGESNGYYSESVYAEWKRAKKPAQYFTFTLP